jgi:hypothetical protein
MPMSTEDRKLYNVKYYTENKINIKEKLLAKVECPLCHKHISKVNLERHKVGQSCQKNANKTKSEFDELKEQVARLTKLLINEQ